MNKKKYNMKNICVAKLHIIAIISIFALFWLGLSAWAQQTHYAELKAVKTDLIHGYCVGLFGQHSVDFTNNTTTDDMLVFVAWTTNTDSHGHHIQIAVPSKPEYAYQVELFDTNGVIVPKTELGKTAGTKFFEYDTNAYRNGIEIKHLTVTKPGEVTSAPLLFRPSDYFKIEKPGHYTLQIRFQIEAFPRFGPGRNDYSDDLIRFPPLNYPLVKPGVQLDTNSIAPVQTHALSK